MEARGEAFVLDAIKADVWEAALPGDGVSAKVSKTACSIRDGHSPYLLVEDYREQRSDPWSIVLVHVYSEFRV